MNNRKKLEARARSIVEELRARRTPSQKQAEHAIRSDRRDHDENVDPASDEYVDEGAWGVDEPESMSTSERQAARATRGRSGRAS